MQKETEHITPAGYAGISPESTEADFLSGRMGYALGFDSPNQIMVDLWSEGFQLGALPASASDVLARYCQAREQLATYMREQILQAYVQFGSAQAVCAWYDEAVKARRNTLIELSARAVAVRHGKLERPGAGYVAIDKFLQDPYHVVVEEARKAPDKTAASMTFGSLNVSPASNDYVCAVTGDVSEVVVKFTLDHWEDMELLLGAELPKVLKGWQRYRLPVKHRSRARYDAVGMVGTPIEHCVQAYFQDKRESCEAAGLNLAREIQYLSAFNPNITVGFSVKGLQKIWKKLDIV